MKIGDIFCKDGLKGVVIFVDNSGSHGMIMSLDEASLNWHESNNWCKKLGEGWFMPSRSDYESMQNKDNLDAIQNALIQNGMPLCFGDTTLSGINKMGHMYWTQDLQYCSLGRDFMYVFCLCSSGFSGFSSDYKEAEDSYIRAMHKF